MFHFWMFLAVQDSPIGDLVTYSLSQTCFDFSVKCISHLDNSSICSDCKIKSLS